MACRLFVKPSFCRRLALTFSGRNYSSKNVFEDAEEDVSKQLEIDSPVLERVKSATLFVRSRFKFGEVCVGLASCTAYLVTKNGYAASAAHGLAEKFTVEDKNGKFSEKWFVADVKVNFNGEEEVPAKVVAIDISTDLAILKVPEEYIKPDQATIEFSAENSLVAGEKLYFVGHPNWLPFCIREGIFSSYREFIDFSEKTRHSIAMDTKLVSESLRFLEVAGVAPPGCSGAAVINRRGQNVGVITIGLDDIHMDEGAVSFLAVTVPSVIELLEYTHSKDDQEKIFVHEHGSLLDLMPEDEEHQNI